MRSRALAQLPKPVVEDLTHLGALLREARGRRGFTQAEIAQRLKLSPTTVRAAEQGDPAVSAGIFASLLWTLGMGPISASVAASHPEARQPKRRVRTGKRLNESTLLNALSSVARFGLDADEAVAIANRVLRVVKDQWEQRFRDVGVPVREIESLRGTSVLSPVAVALATRPK